jgi:aryl-alcohol dehydrogenase-like predicted oxidoreductase
MTDSETCQRAPIGMAGRRAGQQPTARRTRMKRRRLGAHGPSVAAIGLGCMGMSGTYGPADDAESVRTVHAALDAGITLLDTGDFYGMGHNELLLREALRGGRRDTATLSVKFGAQRGPDGAWLGFDGRPAAVKASLAYSLQRLGTDHVDIYRPARLDPAVPIEDTIGAIAELVDAGYVRHIGLSEVGPATLRRAAAVHPIADLQIEYSLLFRGIEEQILPTCRELGIGITAYGVLSRGLLSGRWRADQALPANDMRAHTSRFQGDNLAHNLALVEALRAIAARLDRTVPQLATAWVAARGDDVVPLVGARRVDRIAEAAGAAELELDDETLAAIDAAVPADAAAGDRYPHGRTPELI